MKGSEMIYYSGSLALQVWRIFRRSHVRQLADFTVATLAKGWILQ
jgi:hypothetical protein